MIVCCKYLSARCRTPYFVLSRKPVEGRGHSGAYISGNVRDCSIIFHTWKHFMCTCEICSYICFLQCLLSLEILMDILVNTEQAQPRQSMLPPGLQTPN